MPKNSNNPKVLNHPRYLSMIKSGMHSKLAYFGTYYGYPTCCIEFFATRIFGYNMILTENQENTHKNKGFIPCAKCADKLVEESLDIKTLLVERICDFEFPRDDMD